MKELNSAKELVKYNKDTLPATRTSFSTIVLWKGRQNNESRADFSAKLRNFCKQNNIGFIVNESINESHLGINKLHLNKKGTIL